MVSSSHGTIVRRSMISQETCSFSLASFAAAINTWSCVPQPINVISDPDGKTKQPFYVTLSNSTSPCRKLEFCNLFSQLNPSQTHSTIQETLVWVKISQVHDGWKGSQRIQNFLCNSSDKIARSFKYWIIYCQTLPALRKYLIISIKLSPKSFWLSYKVIIRNHITLPPALRRQEMFKHFSTQMCWNTKLSRFF